MSEAIKKPARTAASQSEYRAAAERRAGAAAAKAKTDAAAKKSSQSAYKQQAAQRKVAGTSGDTGFYEKGAFSATFLVEVDGKAIGRFIEASGLEVEVEVETYEEGGQNGFVHKFPGRMSWPNLVLKRGITESDGLLAWLNKSSGEGFTGASNKLTRSTMAVVLVSAAGVRLRAWNFEGAFPIRWNGPSFASDSDTLAEEELEIAHHGFKSATP
jgi:phage tail-like protein